MVFLIKNVFHISFWVFSVVIYSIFFVNFHSYYKVILFIAQAALLIFFFYWNAEQVITWLKKRRILWVYLFVFPLIVVLFGVSRKMIVIILKWLFNFDFIHTESFNSVLGEVLIAIPFMSASFLYKLISDWSKNENTKRELINQQQITELMFLKSQVNPHFLFNTLNNLYYLCLKKDDRAPDILMKMSDFMRYVISASSMARISLSEELHYVENYIELERLRVQDSKCIIFLKEGDVENHQIAPLLLLPFIENAFKHSKDLIYKGLNVTISIRSDKLVLHVSNYYNMFENATTSGVGLENARRRLELTYPNNYSLEISQESGIFQVNLTVNLNVTPLHSY